MGTGVTKEKLGKKCTYKNLILFLIKRTVTEKYRHG